MTTSPNDYIACLNSALRSNRQAWFPLDKGQRREMNLRLGREFGYGLGAYEDGDRYAGETYGAFVVANSFDSVGVVIDASDWLKAIREGAEKYRGHNA